MVEYVNLYGGFVVGVLVLAVAGQLMRQAQVTLMIGLVLCVVAPHPNSLVLALVIALVVRASGFVKVGG